MYCNNFIIDCFNEFILDSRENILQVYKNTFFLFAILKLSKFKHGACRHKNFHFNGTFLEPMSNKNALF